MFLTALGRQLGAVGARWPSQRGKLGCACWVCSSGQGLSPSMTDPHSRGSTHNTSRRVYRSCCDANIGLSPFGSTQWTSQAWFGRSCAHQIVSSHGASPRIRCPQHFTFVRHPCPLQKHNPAIAALYHFGQSTGGEWHFHPCLRHYTDA